jgi:RNA polymerase primary sigma factor
MADSWVTSDGGRKQDDKNGELTQAWALVESNLSFASWVARTYRSLGVAEEDLEAEGYLGLLDAALRFDPRRGVKFVTYAAWWVRKRIQELIAAQAGLVQVPEYQRRRLCRVRISERVLASALGRKPTIEEIAWHCELDRREVESLLEAARREVSLEEFVNPNSDLRVKEVLSEERTPPADAALIRAELCALIFRLMHRLTERQRRVLALRYGLEGRQPLPLAEVARQIGVSRERVRQVELKALRELRSLMNV